MPRSGRATRALLATAALAVPVLVAGHSAASTPASSTLTAPTVAGRTVTATWKGTIPVGANPTNTCTVPGTDDSHGVTLAIPAAARGLLLRISVKIAWTPLAAETANDEVLTVLGPDGTELGSSDGGSTTESVSAQDSPASTSDDLAAGTYTALACGFANSSPQDYTGTMTVTVEQPPAVSSLPLTPTALQFSATVPADPQRDEGEPAVTMDRDGNIYTCGPSGFSQVADYAQISTDGGDQFHTLGTPPRGQMSVGEGGGDCALATSPVKNAAGHYTLAYAGLGPLTNFSTATSADAGRTLIGSPVSESVPGVDRQWITFTDASTAFLNYNSTALGGQTVQKSVDGGLTYDSPGTVASTDGGRIGQIRSFLPKGVTDPAKAFVYFPYDAGNMVKIALSQDGGDTWSQCVAVDAGVSPTAGFVAADNDEDGNVYVVYAEKGAGRDTYLVSIPFDRFRNCKGTSSDSSQNNVNPGFSRKLRINRGGVETTVMPWVAAGGRPGRVAISFYGTPAVGDPDSGDFKAAWNVYVGQVLDALAPAPHVSMVKATTHPSHYDSICLNGLGCDISMGDRSLVDYFTIDYNRKSGKLALVYSQAGKIPGEASGHVATPAVVTQVAGPSNGGGTVDGGYKRHVLRTGSPDPAGDALANYSFTVPVADAASALKPASTNEKALDFVGSQAVTVGPYIDLATGKTVPDKGFTVTLHLADLSDAALSSALNATTSSTLQYLFRFVDGYQSSAAVASYDPARGFRFGFNGYVVGSAQCGSDGDKCLLYPGDTPIQGKVDQAKGTITMSVPRQLTETLHLMALGGPDSSGQRPSEVRARPGDRMYDATAYALANPSIPEASSYLYSVDNAPAFDFALPGAAPVPLGASPAQDAPQAAGPEPDGAVGAGGGTLAATGLGTALPVAALLVLLGAALAWRRGRRTAERG